MSKLSKQNLKDLLFTWELYRHSTRHSINEIISESTLENLHTLVQALISNIDSFTDSNCLRILKERLKEVENKLVKFFLQSETARLDGILEPICEDKYERDLIPLDYNIVLYIVYIALRKSGVAVLPNDIVVFARNGKIPYLNGIQGFFPNEQV